MRRKKAAFCSVLKSHRGLWDVKKGSRSGHVKKEGRGRINKKRKNMTERNG